MPILVTNVGAETIPAGHLVDTAGTDGVRLAAAAVPGATSILLAARPRGITLAPILPGASGEIAINGTQEATLAPNEAAEAGQRAISAGSGRVKPAPLGYTGWGVGIFDVSKAASPNPQSVRIRLGPKV
jgi:hypothetical protein